MDSSGRDSFYEDFVRSRKFHWMQEAKKLGASGTIPPVEGIPLSNDDSNFFVSAEGHNSLQAVFEDANDTGWLYIYDASLKQIINGIPVYNRGELNVNQGDIDLAWSKDQDICCVAIWEQIRAFLGVNPEIAMRRTVKDRESVGFYANEWPEGFSYLLKKSE
jgi:hypothetical protein